MQQSYFLTQFLDEIERTRGADARAGLEDELLTAARRAVVSVVGDGTPTDVVLGEDIGDIRVLQLPRAVANPGDPAREIALAAARDAFPDVPDIADGDEIAIPIFYTHAGDEAAWVDAHPAIAALAPLPLHDERLWDALTDAVNPILVRHFPPPACPEGSLGELLRTGGGWTRGLAVRSADLELVLESAYFRLYRTSVTSGWVEYGFRTAVRRGAGDAEVSELGRGDNDGNLASWSELPTSEEARPALLAVLQTIADRLAAGEETHIAVDAVLAAAITPPAPDGLWAWMTEALPRLLTGHRHTAGEVTFEVTAVYPPVLGLVSFGDAAVRIRIGDQSHPIQLGSAPPTTLALRGPTTDDERRDLERIALAFRDWLDAHLDHHVAQRGAPKPDDGYYLYAFAGHFPLIRLLEQRLRLGPPGPPPVPPFDDAALDRAARLVRPSDRAGAHTLAAFDVAGWTVMLEDDREGMPFGSRCGILLQPPGGEPFAVMMVDAWNPPTRCAVDGDPFAFRRFVTWLRAAILRGGLDRKHAFPADNFDPDAGTVTLALSDWLLFGLPDCGDRFLVDWRGQWDIVGSSAGIEGFAGIFGFTGEQLARIAEHDVPTWRRFLREVVFAG